MKKSPKLILAAGFLVVGTNISHAGTDTPGSVFLARSEMIRIAEGSQRSLLMARLDQEEYEDHDWNEDRREREREMIDERREMEKERRERDRDIAKERSEHDRERAESDRDIEEELLDEDDGFEATRQGRPWWKIWN